MNERGEPGRAFDDGADRGPIGPDDEVALAVARDRAVFSLLGPLADQDVATT